MSAIVGQTPNVTGIKKLAMLNLAIIERRATRIRQMKVENVEAARQRLFRDVLQAIADKALGRPALCAAAALKALPEK